MPKIISVNVSFFYSKGECLVNWVFPFFVNMVYMKKTISLLSLVTDQFIIKSNQWKIQLN